MKSLFRSRKFVLMLLDAIVSFVLMLLAPFEDAVFAVIAIQPVLITMIVAITIEDVKRATTFDPIPPLLYLLRSGRFWLVVLDIGVTLFGYFGLKYMNPANFETARWTIMTFKPVIVTMIAAVTGENINTSYKEAEVLEVQEIDKWLEERREQTHDHYTETEIPVSEPE